MKSNENTFCLIIVMDQDPYHRIKGLGMKLPPTFDVQDRKLIPMFNIYLRISFF